MTKDEPGVTRSLGHGSGGKTRGTTSAPHLFLLLDAARPLSGSVRHSLAEIDEVVIGRGAERAVERAGESGARRLHLTVPDEWTSLRHAVLTRPRSRWLLDDAGSKNGSFVNGEKQTTALLFDGDYIELGRTFFLFRNDMSAAADGSIELHSAEITAPRGMATLATDLAAAFDEMVRIAPTRAPVLVCGPSGTGKELLARAVHAHSGRAGELVPVNCGALTESLLESELFGYRKGAFSGATEDRDGLVSAADGGTLFLDEIGDFPARSQVALLRVLEEGEVRPVGATASLRVDLRVVAATHRDLGAMVASGDFREDLFARLSGFEVTLPALRDRREDLGLLIAELLPRAAGKAAADSVAFSNEAVRALLGYDWPRNIREPRQVSERSVALAAGNDVELEHLPPELREPAKESASGAKPLSEEDEKRRDDLVVLLEEHGGNVSAVARAMGKARPQIQRWIKRYGIDAEALRR